MSSDLEITCPHCHQKFALNETLAGPLLDKVRSDHEKEISDERAKTKSAQAALAKRQDELDARAATLEEEVQRRVKADYSTQEAQIRERIANERALQDKANQDRMSELADQSKKAIESELEQRKLRQQSEDKIARLQLEAQKEAEQRAAAVRIELTQHADQQRALDAEKHRLELAEKEKKISDLTALAAELERKGSKGSQQLQGDVAEVELEAQLRAAFPTDDVSPVKTGARGADVQQIVRNANMAAVGLIIWERKRTQAWSGEWASKAKYDQREAKADVAVIVSDVLPKGVAAFDIYEGVWVCAPALATSFARLLREQLFAAATALRTAEGRRTGAERAYDYLMGKEFAARVKGVTEPFLQLRDDLDQERRTMTRHWARRQKQIERVLEAAYGMHGDLEAVVGSPLPELEAIEMKALESPASSAVVEEELPI